MLVVLFNGILNTTERRDPPKMGRPSASVSSPAKPTTFANKSGDATKGHSFGKEVKEAAASGGGGGGGPITVAVLLLLNADLESPTLPREMRLQDLPSEEEKTTHNLGTREDGDRDEDHQDKDKEGKRKRASLSLEERLRDVPEEKTIVIGRNNTNTYVLDVPDLPYLLSRTHANALTDEHFIYDFKTTNGTYINGKIIEKQKFVKLMHGDIVSFGGPANVLKREIDEELSIPVFEDEGGKTSRRVRERFSSRHNANYHDRMRQTTMQVERQEQYLEREITEWPETPPSPAREEGTLGKS